ncbi:MAG: hypothetical protein JWM80_358 [Cyanobacteria bacterium RYN_339]|nr:hypothetical protein [Cyanobacteria bacterium RYN_339]
MAKYDLDASHSDPYARRTNRAAVAGMFGTLALIIGAGWFQAHPYQPDGPQASNWHATVAYGGLLYDPAGPVASLPDDQMAQVGITSDGRGVYEPRGGGGGKGSPQLYVQMDSGLYLPLRGHTGRVVDDLPLGGLSDPQQGRTMRLPGQPPPGILP